MPATKTKKKVVAAKKVGKSTKKVVRASSRVSAAPVSELFSTQASSERTIEVPSNSVALFINSVNKGIVDTEGKTVGDFVSFHAEREGIRSFSVYLDGVKVDTGDSGKRLSQFSKVELVRKDSRG
jgi:uncharacterized protein YcgI (DUF1989 family)